MERNYPTAGFGDLEAAAGWRSDRSTKASLVYGSSRSPHPDSELLHRQAYGPPHPLQGYATSSRQGGVLGPPGRTLGLSGLFDTSLHHATTSGPDPAVMNLISAFESRGPQSTPSASSLLSPFRPPSWQPTMHTQASAELFISGALKSSGSFPSTISAYRHPGSFTGRSLTPLSFQDTSTYSPSSNGFLSPHDSLLNIKTPPQSSLGYDRLLSSQTATFRGSQESPAAQNQTTSDSTSCHLPPPQFNLLSSQLPNRFSQLYNSSMFSSAVASPDAAAPQTQPASDRGVSRQDSVIKHYQRSPPSPSASLQQYGRYGGSSRYQPLVTPYLHTGMPSSPVDEQCSSTDPKPPLQREPETYQPDIQTTYTVTPTISSISSSLGTEGPNGSCSTSGSSSSSSRTPHSPKSASLTLSSSKTNSNSISAPSCQQPVPQLDPALPLLPSTDVHQPAVTPCLPSYSSISLDKSSTIMMTPPQSHAQSYSPGEAQSAHKAQTFEEFGSPRSQDLSSGGGVTGGKAFNSMGSEGRSFSAETVFGDSSYGSPSFRRATSPALDYKNESGRIGPISGATTQRCGIGSVGSVSAISAVCNESSYHLPESSKSPAIISNISHSVLHTPSAPTPSPGSSGGTKYLSSILSPAFMSSPQSFPDAQQTQSGSNHSSTTKPKTDTALGAADGAEVEEAEDFLSLHLIHTQKSTAHLSEHHSQHLFQCISQAEDRDSKRMSFDIDKLTNERYHPQSVIRTNDITNHSDPEAAMSETASDLNRQLESTQKKRQTKSDLTVSKSPFGDEEVISDSLSQSETIQTNQLYHESLGSVEQYERGDPYTQHSHHQQSYHTSNLSLFSQQNSQHSQERTQLTQPSQHSQANAHSQNNPHMDLQKNSNKNDNAYLRNTPDLLLARQCQPPLSFAESLSDPSQSTHIVQSVLTYTPSTKIDLSQVAPQQQQQPHHHLSQKNIMGTTLVKATGVVSNSQNLSPHVLLSLQNQVRDTHYSFATRSRGQPQANTNPMSPLDMLDQSLSQNNNSDTDQSLGVNVPVGEASSGDRYRHQHRLKPQHHSQPKHSDLHNLLAEQDLGQSASFHVHHLNSPAAQTHAHALQGQQAHPHRQISGERLGHPQTQGMTANMASPHHPPQTHQRDPQMRLPHSRLDQLKLPRFDTISPANKNGLNQIHQQTRFPPLTSICSPDSFLQDEYRPFFPEMEDAFCPTAYRSSCTGDSGARLDVHGQSQQGMESLKMGTAREGYDVGIHHTDQGYGQYCHNLPRKGNDNQHLDFDSLKTHKLPLTVNTEQLGLIQSQAPSIALGSEAQRDGSVNKIMGSMGGNSGTTGLTSPIFCSSRPRKLLKTSSFHLLKQRRETQAQTKKNYPQEYEFEDDEDKADAPADIRLTSRRVPDLLPDLVSSCRRSTSATGLTPMMGDVEFCHPSSYTLLAHHSQVLPHNGPKKRGRKPTKPKRGGPPRPRGRPRIHPHPEPPFCRGIMGSATGQTRRGRGRGRGRGRREEGLVETHEDINKAQSLPYNHQQQQYVQQQHVQQLPHQHYSLQTDLNQAPHEHVQNHFHHQQQVSFSNHQLHHQQLYQPEKQEAPQEPQQDSTRPFKMKQLHPAMPQSLLKTDSLSSSEPLLSDGSVGSAPSLGLSPGPNRTIDAGRNDHDEAQEKMMVYDWKQETDPESWADLQKLSTSAEDKDFDFRPGLMASFLDSLRTGRKESDLTLEALDACSSLKGGVRPLSSSPPSLPLPSPQPPLEAFSEEGQGGGNDLALSGCSSPSKPLDDDLKRNLETLPSFSSDEEESVSKNQDLQKSISSAISALYDTPHALAAVMASTIIKTPPSPSPPTPQEPSLSPPLSALPPLTPTVGYIKDQTLMQSQDEVQGEEQGLITPPPSRLKTEEGDHKQQGEEEEDKTENKEKMKETGDPGSQEEEKLTESLDAPKAEDPPSEPVLAPTSPSHPLSVAPSPPTYSTASSLPSLSLFTTSSLPIQQGEDEAKRKYWTAEAQPLSYHQASTAGTSPPPSTSPPAILSSPLSSLPRSIPPPSTTPPPSSSDQDQYLEAGGPSSPSASSASSEPPSPPTPEETSRRLTSLHLAKKQADAAIAGESEEEDSESGGEGIFRERDEFVVRTEDIGTLKMALQTGREPPPIWRVQKALLQKFSPEIKDGQRQFCATSNYLGYFGDAKMCYQRLYVKFLENVNKKDYVRVCSRKPWHRTALALRRQSLARQLLNSHSQPRAEREDRDKERQKERDLKEQRARERREEREKQEREHKEKMIRERERRECSEKERENEQKERERREAEEKDRQREQEKREQEWRERRRREREQQEFERKERRMEILQQERQREKKQREQKEREQREKRQGQDGSPGSPKEERTSKDRAEPPSKKRKTWLKEVPSSSSESDSSRHSEDGGPVQEGVNSRAMREMFRSYVEMLVSTALDPDMIQALEDTDDELYLPPMRKIDSLLNDQKKMLLRRISMSAQHQEALHTYPNMTADPLGSGAVRVHLGGEGYSRKTLSRVKKSVAKQQDMKLSMETCRIYSLYHSLHHYKYHTFLHCKREAGNVEQAAEDPGQEEVVQQCMANQAWLEDLFSSFVELLSLSAKA